MTAYELIVKILKVVLTTALIVAVVAIIATILYVKFYQGIPKDIDPPDDTALMITRPKITDEENGYLKMMEAAWDLYKSPVEENDLKNIFSLEDEKIEKIAKICETRLLKIDEALAYSVFQEPLEMISGRIPNYLAIRDLSKLRVAIAWKNLREGNEEDALEQLLKSLDTGQALEDASVTIVCFMIGNGIKDMVFENIHEMIESGLIDEGSYAQLARELSEYRQSAQGYSNAIKGECLFYKKTYLDIENNRIKDLTGVQKIKHLLDPQRGSLFKVNRTLKLTMDNYVPFIEVIGRYYKDIDLSRENKLQKNRNKYIENWPRALATSNLVGETLYFIAVKSDIRISSLKRYYYSEFAAEGLRTTIAALAYESEYGELPASLESLVPEFLPSVPIDPFDGSPLRYDKEKRAVYSVGQNLIDEGGSAKVSALDSSDFKMVVKQDDYVVYIPEPKKLN
ncbi:MAG TPA: hypothetical protein PKH33_16610 [bacterium]|nr:hypothetical protein [bacterium]